MLHLQICSWLNNGQEKGLAFILLMSIHPYKCFKNACKQKAQVPCPFIRWFNYEQIDLCKQVRNCTCVVPYNKAAQPYYSSHVETMALHTPLKYLSSKKKTLCYELCCQLCSTYYVAVAAVQINNSLKNFCNQNSHYENYGRSPFRHQAGR